MGQQVGRNREERFRLASERHRTGCGGEGVPQVPRSAARCDESAKLWASEADVSRALHELRRPHEKAATTFARDLLRKEEARKDFTVYRPRFEEDTARIAWELGPRDTPTIEFSTSADQTQTALFHSSSARPNATASATGSEFAFTPLYPEKAADPPSGWPSEFKHLYCQAIARLRSYLDLAAATVYNDLTRDLNYRLLEYVNGVPGALRHELGLNEVSKEAKERAKRLCDAGNGTAAKRRKLNQDCKELDRLERALEGCV